MNFTTHSEAETKKVAAEFAATLKGGDIVMLTGELGVGKTTFVKGVAAAFGIEESEITSPTFTLMNVYDITALKQQNSQPEPKGIKTLIHIDTYRLEDAEELEKIGVEDYLGEKNTVCLIEWPEKIRNIISGKKLIRIELKYLNLGKRKINTQKIG